MRVCLLRPLPPVGQPFVIPWIGAEDYASGGRQCAGGTPPTRVVVGMSPNVPVELGGGQRRTRRVEAGAGAEADAVVLRLLRRRGTGIYERGVGRDDRGRRNVLRSGRDGPEDPQRREQQAGGEQGRDGAVEPKLGHETRYCSAS
jgi:hypothetical protein